jgi:hypothetical protein
MIVVTALCVGLGWWSERAWRQHEAVAAILKAGGDVHYPDKALSDLKPGEIGPTVVELTGNDPHIWLDFFKSPVGVNVYSGKADDELCRYLALVESLTAVSLPNSSITDVGLSRLSALKKLEWLDLEGTQITDDGLVHLKSLSELDVLALKHTQISDKGLDHLMGLKKLDILLLRGSKVTNSGASSFKMALPTCRVFLTKTEWTPPPE